MKKKNSRRYPNTAGRPLIMSSSNGEQECHACKLFVGGLHLETNNDSLRAYFEKYGEVCDAVVMIDGDTKKSRGFGFITFSDVSQAEVCLHKDNLPHYIDEKQVSFIEFTVY